MAWDQVALLSDARGKYLLSSGQCGTHTHTHTPVYDVELTSVPADWEGSKVPANHTRLRERSWQKVVRTTIRQQYRAVKDCRPAGSS